MHRFYLPPAQCQSPVLVLKDDEAHHALNVLRLRAGERCVVLDGAGAEFLCEVRQTTARTAELAMVQKNRIPPLPYQLTLLQAIPKGRTMDTIVQKATELGAHRIVPILAERTVAHLGGQNVGHKVEKWNVTVVEALKQCGSAWRPQLEQPVTPQAFLSRKERFDLSLLATLQSDARHPRTCIATFEQENGRLPRSVALWVGPEGDYTPAEINLIRATDALPITLGQLVLRSETAAIYCLAVLNYELQAPRA